jgi:predicted nuclease of predicted toxin-antitoxin system
VARTVKFYLDENVHRYPAVAAGLRRRGIDVQTVMDSNLRTATDQEQFAYAQKTGRVIFSHDDDILVLASRADHHAGVAFCELHVRTIGQIIQGLALIWEVLEADEMYNNIEFI